MDLVAGQVEETFAVYTATSVGNEPPNGKGFGYKDIDTLAHGVKKLRLRSGSAGQPKILLLSAD